MWGPIIGAGLSAFGSVLGGSISSAGAASANSANAQLARERMSFEQAEAQKQMDFQERMSSSAYQRAMADMKTAGLNPILAYQQGGASSPGGAMASASAATMENALQGIGEGVTSASQAGARFMELKNLAAQTDNTKSQEALNTANSELSKVNAVKAAQETVTSASAQKRADAETANILASADNPAAIRALMKGQETSAYAAANESTVRAQQLEKYGPHWTGQIGGTVERLIQAIRGTPEKTTPHVPPGPKGPDKSFENFWNKYIKR